MSKIKIFLLSLLLHPILFILFRTNKWIIRGADNLNNAMNSNASIMLCSWHERFLYAVYFLKKYKIKNVWAVSSTHQDSQIMARFLTRSSFNLIKGSSTRGWENVIKQMLKIFKESNSIIAITNDGPKGPPKQAKFGSYKIAIKSKAQIIAISCASTKFWTIQSWDRLRIPKPFGEIYIEFSKPMIINENIHDTTDANELTSFLNDHLKALDDKIK